MPLLIDDPCCAECPYCATTVFGALPESDLTDLMDGKDYRHFCRGESLFLAGDTSHSLYSVYR